MNNEKALNDLLLHLVEQDCRRFVFLGSKSENYDGVARRAAFLQFMKQRNMQSEVIRITESYECARQATAQFIDNHGKLPHAIVCFNDDLALGAYDAIKEKGLHIPHDVAVTGFDDILFTEFLGITTIRVPGLAMGQEAARLLIARLDKKGSFPSTRNAVFDLETRFRNSSLFKR